MRTGPLRGWTVGVTADRRAAEQVEMLEGRGARVVHAPVIRTVALELDDRVAEAVAAAVEAPLDVVVLSTGVGTRALLDAADCLGMGEALRTVFGAARVLARGPKASGAAVTGGLTVAWQAPGATSAEVLRELADEGVAGQRVAIQLDGQDVPMLADAVAELGAHVVAIPVYRWTHPADLAPVVRLIDNVCTGRVDAVTLTSTPALRNIVEIAGSQEAADSFRAALNGPVAAVSIGAVCSAAARAAGIEPAVEPLRHRLGAMVMALADHAEATAVRTARSVDGRTVDLRAASVVVDEHVVDLPPQEHAALASLLEQGGSVVAKDRLLRAAWSSTADEHAVEVAIGRLRRRLDGLLRIRTVPDRGYIVTAA